MDVKTLKEMLKDGKITEEQYKAMLKLFGLKDEGEGDGSDPDDPLAGIKDEDVKKRINALIQSAFDRGANKGANAHKDEYEALKKKYEDLQKAKLTAEELKAAEDKQREEDLKAKEHELTLATCRLTASQELTRAGLENSEDVVNLVLGADVETTKSNVKNFTAIINRLVKEQVEKKFKDSGRNPGKGGSGSAGTDNPWLKDHFNLTKQMQIEINNPELAKQLKQAAGVKN